MKHMNHIWWYPEFRVVVTVRSCPSGHDTVQRSTMPGSVEVVQWRPSSLPSCKWLCKHTYVRDPEE
jgi:hypothetical protein